MQNQPTQNDTKSTRLLDFNSKPITDLVNSRGWKELPVFDAIGAVYNYVRNEIDFGYNEADDIPASAVMADGYGQCNTKGTLLMALLRAIGVPCRIRGFTIDKSLQRGVVPELVYAIAPDNILHSWVEVYVNDEWVALEGFILDQDYLSEIQKIFNSDNNALCGYAVGTNDLSSPDVKWQGRDTYIQMTGINQDFGTFATPDEFYAKHAQDFGPIRAWMLRNVFRHWMNKRVRNIRNGSSKGYKVTPAMTKPRKTIPISKTA